MFIKKKIKHVEDGKTDVIAKGRYIDGMFVGEYKYKGMTYGVNIPCDQIDKPTKTPNETTN
jgi:hypothetical protein